MKHVKYFILIFVSVWAAASLTAQESDTAKTSEPWYNLKKKDSLYFSLNPGASLFSTDFSIQGSGGTADMSGTDSAWSFDVESRDYLLTKNIGMQLIYHNTLIHLNRQTREISGKSENSSSSSSSSSSNSSSSSSSSLVPLDSASQTTSETYDAGTRMDLKINAFYPVIFYQFKDDQFRIGFGPGSAIVHPRGDFTLVGSSLQGILLYNFLFNNKSALDNKFLNYLQYYYFSSGLVDLKHGDPYVNYFIFNLLDGSNLENLSTYNMLQGYRPSMDTLILAAIIQNQTQYSSRKLNFLESLSLASLGRGYIDFTSRPFFAYQFYLDIRDLYGFRISLNLGGGGFRKGEFDYHLSSTTLTATYPLNF